MGRRPPSAESKFSVLIYTRIVMEIPQMVKNETVEFWRGDFGDEYTQRNANGIHNNIAFFSSILTSCSKGVESVLELGSNRGLNLMALRKLLPDTRFDAVEVNTSAAAILKDNLPGIDVHCSSIQDFSTVATWDLVFTKGVLIHIHPDDLSGVYEKLYTLSKRYILIAEYYNPSPVTIEYRGNQGKLFKRDFAGDLLDRYADLRIVRYGFAYHRDTNFPQDDLTWFLLEKTDS